MNAILSTASTNTHAPMTHNDWGQIEATLSGVIGPRGVAALHQRIHHRLTSSHPSINDAHDASSSAAERQAFWNLTVELLGAPLTDRLFSPITPPNALLSPTAAT